MNDPTKKQMQYVVDKFKTILPLAKNPGQFYMAEQGVSSQTHRCGTVHCVMGWYAVANQDNPHIKNMIEIDSCHYDHGTDLMALDLGFDDTEELFDWAASNPGKWGNKKGKFLDCDIDAYDGAKNMKEVVEFLEKIKGRL